MVYLVVPLGRPNGLSGSTSVCLPHDLSVFLPVSLMVRLSQCLFSIWHVFFFSVSLYCGLSASVSL